MRDYSGAVTAYEDAVRYEPDNDITKNYLKKAKEKEVKQMAKQLASRGGLGAQYGGASDMSLSGSVGDSIMAANMSVVSDPNQSAAVVSSNAGMRGITSDRIGAVVSKELKRSAVAVGGAPLAGVDENNATIDEEDPDFDEALRLHEMATASLASKNYKDAVEAYSAALFLVPDDGILSPSFTLVDATPSMDSSAIRQQPMMPDLPFASIPTIPRPIRPLPRVCSTRESTKRPSKPLRGAHPSLRPMKVLACSTKPTWKRLESASPRKKRLRTRLAKNRPERRNVSA